MSREERKSGWKLFLSIKSVKMLIYFLKSLVEINPCDIYNTHTLPGLKYHWSCKYEGQWREMIGMGRKKKFDIFTKHSPPQRGWSGFQRLLLSPYFFFNAMILSGKHRFTHTTSSSETWLHWKALSLSSPVKNKNHLVLQSCYFAVTLKINATFFFFPNHLLCFSALVLR